MRLLAQVVPFRPDPTGLPGSAVLQQLTDGVGFWALIFALAGMLVGGFICNYLITPLADKWFMKDEEVAALQQEFLRRQMAAAAEQGKSLGTMVSRATSAAMDKGKK